VLASNIANADTPEYRPRDVEFRDYLEAELDLPDYVGPNPGTPRAEIRYGVEPGLDGNYVDVEQETVRMTSNRLFYELTTELISRSLSGLTYAIDEGGR
jgi:flagellar basal-body rod protein FlgB